MGGGSRPERRRAVEPDIASLVTGVLTLIGALVSNSKNRAAMKQKIEALAMQVETHNSPIEHVQPRAGHGGGAQRHRDAEEGGQ